MTDYTQPLSELVIDLSAVAQNWLALNSRLTAGADCAAVVKADAYGLGATRVAGHLYDQGCRHFFVAHALEAAEITPVLVARATMATADRARIYVLNGPYGMPAREMVAAGFVPVLNTLDEVSYWAGQSGGGAAVVHVDTGMNRLGLALSDLEDPRVGAWLASFDLRYVMSHLACSDDPAHPLNALQLQRLQDAARRLKRPVRLSLANSGGILLGADYHCDLVRPGCALYGINPHPASPTMAKNVVTARGRIMQVREVAAGQSIGYGASYTVPQGAKYATHRYAAVSVGYADGYLRSLGQRGQVAINGQLCPVAGRVSMDTVVVDVSHLPQPPQAGDWAELIGATLPVDTVAAMAGTIGYEILTSLGQRYARRYTGE